jgi:hypothetical protein
MIFARANLVNVLRMHFNRSGHNFCHASDKIRCAPVAAEEQGAIVKTQLTARGARNSGKQLKRKTLGSGLNAGNIGAEIDVIKPTLPA